VRELPTPQHRQSGGADKGRIIDGVDDALREARQRHRQFSYSVENVGTDRDATGGDYADDDDGTDLKFDEARRVNIYFYSSFKDMEFCEFLLNNILSR
jgi:hypothetical protein